MREKADDFRKKKLMTSPLRTGWIGCGNHAKEMLLPQLIRCDATLDAICDISEENLALTARRYNIPVSSQHRDWRELLARSDLDAIGLSMGPAQHLETGFAAIERGLPCFMEKPPAPDAAGSARLAEAAKARGALVVPGFMKRYSTANRIAANIIHGGEFGPAASFLGESMTAPHPKVCHPRTRPSSLLHFRQ